MSEIALAVTGMTCTDCARHVEQALRRVSGVRQVRVEYPQGVARINSEFPPAIDMLNAAPPKSHRVTSLPPQDARGNAAPPSALLNKALGAFSDVHRTSGRSGAPLHITVIGTGGGGMAAAITAAEHGAKDRRQSGWR